MGTVVSVFQNGRCWRGVRMTSWSPQQDAALKGNFRAHHGHTCGRKRSPEYSAWTSMVSRCRYAGRPGSENYRGRGISVCPEWQFGNGVLNAFECFLRDVGCRPSSKHSIDRIDNEGNYEPDNVRWSTRSEQNRNKRNIRLFDVFGDPLCLKDLHRQVGRAPYQTCVSRISLGWKIEDALFTPPGSQRGDWHPDCKMPDLDFGDPKPVVVS